MDKCDKNYCNTTNNAYIYARIVCSSVNILLMLLFYGNRVCTNYPPTFKISFIIIIRLIDPLLFFIFVVIFVLHTKSRFFCSKFRKQSLKFFFNKSRTNLVEKTFSSFFLHKNKIESQPNTVHSFEECKHFLLEICHSCFTFVIQFN